MHQNKQSLHSEYMLVQQMSTQMRVHRDVFQDRDVYKPFWQNSTQAWIQDSIFLCQDQTRLRSRLKV